MKQAQQFGRLITATVTPFDEHGRVDFKRFAELVDYQFENGADSIVVCGTTGESPCLPIHDKLALFEEALRTAAGRGKIIANVGDNCTYDSAMFAREAVSLGVDGIMCVVPYYNKPSQQGMYEHFKYIAQAAPATPVVIYNIPGRCVVNMDAPTVLRVVAACPNVRAMKQAAINPEEDKAILAEAPADFEIFSGNDEKTLEMMAYGASGVISTASNVAPALMADLVNSFAAGNVEHANALQERLLPLMTGLFKAPNPTLVKEAMRLTGRPVGGLRLPLVDATPEQSAFIAGVLDQVGIR